MDRIFGKDLSNILQPPKVSRPTSRSKIINRSTNSLIVRDKSKSRLKKFERMQKAENCQMYQLKPKIKQNEQNKKPQSKSNQDQIRKDPQSVPQHFKQCLQFTFDQQFKNYKLNNYISRKHNNDEGQSLRAQVVDWIVLVHLKFKMTPASLYAAVMIVDKYWNEKAVKKQERQIIGAAAMFMAAKYQQIYQIPKLSELAYLSPKNISKRQILQMQAEIMKTLNFQLIMITCYNFFSPLSYASNIDPKCKHLVQYIMQLSLHSSKFLNFKPSILAVSSMYLANKLLNKQQLLPEVVRNLTRIQQKSLGKCVKQLQLFLSAAEELPYTKTIRSKYSSSEFQGVSRISSDGKIL